MGRGTRAFGSDGRKGLALVGAVLVAGCAGCETRVLGDIVTTHDAGMEGTAGTSGEGGAGGNSGSGAGGSVGGGSGAAGSGERCPLSCGAEACSFRVGEPRTIVTSPYDQQIMALAVNADTLFWGTYPNQSQMGEIRSMPLAGGPSTLLVSNVRVSNLYLDGSTLYYVTSGFSASYALFAVPVTGGTPRMIAAGAQIQWITSDASYIYFVQGGIMRADRAGSGVTSVVAPMGTVWGFAVDATNIYWAAYSNGGTLYRRALAGGDVTAMHTSTQPITFPIIDGDDIDFVEGINTPDTCMSTVWAIAKAGGTPRQISPGTSGTDVSLIARDGPYLYWSRASIDGYVLRTVKGQRPEVLAMGQDNVTPVVVGATDIFWIAGPSRTAFQSEYEVRTLPK